MKDERFYEFAGKIIGGLILGMVGIGIWYLAIDSPSISWDLIIWAIGFIFLALCGSLMIEGFWILFLWMMDRDWWWRRRGKW